jgi:HK97 family phage portal protein
MSFFKRKRKTGTQKFIREFYTKLIGNNPVVLYNYTLEDYVKRGYSQNDEIYSIIKKITDKANVATPYVYIDKEGVKSKQLDTTRKMRTNAYGAARHRLEVKKALDFAPINNDLSKLIVNPNEMQTWRDFITLVRIFYFVQGEAFIYREAGDDDCALSLHVVPAHLVRSIVDNGILVGWQVDLMNGQVRNFVGDDMKAMLHLKMPNPVFNSDYTHLRGMSPLLAGLKYLQLNEDSLMAWMKSVENEGAKGLISPNHPNPELWLTPEQVDKTQATVEAKIHGYDNRNKLVVSAMPLQYTHIGLSPDALNIVKGLQHSGYKLCNLWGVPPELFNPDPTYQNQKEASIRLVTEVVLPYLNIEEDKLNSWLVEPFRKRDKRNYLIDYDLSAYEELRLSVEDTDMFLKTHTINEVRVMLGSDELDEEYANQVFVQQGLVPLSDYNVEDIQI